MTDYPHVAAGSSISVLLTGYSALVRDWLTSAYPSLEPVQTKSAKSGANSWNNCIRLAADTLACNPELVIFDTANDADNDLGKGSAEGFLRRVWTARPKAKLVLVLPPAVANQNVDANIDNPTNGAALQNVRDLAAHYGIPFVDMQSQFQAMIAAGHHLNEYMSDTIHWTDAGHTLCLNELKKVLTLAFLITPQLGALPAAHFAAAADYAQAPTEKNGTAYDSRTGVWTDNGTATSSSAAGATITYSGTFRSIGCDTGDGSANPDVDISVDGGAYTTIALYGNGWEIAAARAARTVTIKVVSGTVKISKVWLL